MSFQQLIDVLEVPALAAGASVTLEHSLRYDQLGVTPDYIYPDIMTAVQVVGTPTPTSVTFHNAGANDEDALKFFVWKIHTSNGFYTAPGFYYRGLGPNGGGSGGGITPAGISPYGDNRRWNVAFDGSASFTQIVREWNVRDYGADHTGATPANAAIQATFDAMVADPASEGGGCMYFPPGTYLLSATGLGIVCSLAGGLGTNFRIRGAGGTASVILCALGDATTCTKNAFTITTNGEENTLLVVDQLLFLGDTTAGGAFTVISAQNAIEMGSASDRGLVCVRDCQFVGMACSASGIKFTGGQAYAWCNGVWGSACTNIGGLQANGFIWGNGSRQMFTDYLVMHDIANYRGKVLNQGSMPSLVCFNAPAPDVDEENSWFECHHVSADESTGHTILVDQPTNPTGHTCEFVHVSDVKHNCAANPAVYINNAARGVIERIYSGQRDNDGYTIQLYSVENMHVRDCSAERDPAVGPNFGIGVNKLGIDIGAPDNWPYFSQNVQVENCRFRETNGIMWGGNDTNPVRVSELYKGIQYDIYRADGAIGTRLCVKFSDGIEGRVKLVGSEEPTSNPIGATQQAYADGDWARIARKDQVINLISDGTGAFAPNDPWIPGANPGQIARGVATGGGFSGIARKSAVAVLGTVVEGRIGGGSQ